MNHVTHMNESCAVVPLLSQDEMVQVSHVAHMHESCRTYERVTSRT